MNNDKITMTIGASIILNKVLTLILFTDPTPGKTVERVLPFSVKYCLQRAKSQVEKDCATFEQRKADLIKRLGVPQENDPNTIAVPEDKMAEYKDDLLKILQEQVEHQFLRLKPQDVLSIDVEGLSVEEVSLFMALLIDDAELTEELGGSTTPTDSADTTAQDSKVTTAEPPEGVTEPSSTSTTN